MNEKFCKYCNLIKKIEDFNKCSYRSDKLQYRCRQCEKKYKKNNKEKIKQRMKLYHQCPEIKKLRKLNYIKYYSKNKEKIWQYTRKWEKENRIKNNLRRQRKYNENPELNAKKAKEKRYRNIDYYRKYQREWMKRKRQENPRYAIEHRLRSRVSTALKRQGAGKKAYKTTDLLGCEIDFFIKYIESLFTEGMNWEKLKNKEIEIDHILPCCQFNLLDENEQKKCFHYTNLQPIWKKDHIIKSKEDRKLTIKNEKAKEILNP